MIRQAQVTETNGKTDTARTTAADWGQYVSPNLQVVIPACGGFDIIMLPKAGDHCLTSTMDNGQQEGHILGRVFTANNLPRGGANSDQLVIVSMDGKTVVKLDAGAGTIDVLCREDLNIKAKNATIEVEEVANIKAKEVNLEADTVEVKGQDVTITGGNLTVDGSVAPTGSGPFCALPACMMTGSPHIGNKVMGT
jgi:phage baseplate assembly protein gpV